jgi:hypothetical protein
MRNLSGKILVIFAVIGSLCTLASATTVIPMSVEELTNAAERVVQGHAVEAWSNWNPEHTLIFTYTRFQIDENLKGISNSVITVKQLGGSAGGYTQHVAGVHHWSPGESAVLFLRASAPQDGTFAVVGLMQGDFRVRRSATGEMVADNGVHASAAKSATTEGGVSVFNPATGAVGEYTGAQLTLKELQQRVRRAVNAARNPE